MAEHRPELPELRRNKFRLKGSSSPHSRWRRLGELGLDSCNPQTKNFWSRSDHFVDAGLGRVKREGKRGALDLDAVRARYNLALLDSGLKIGLRMIGALLYVAR